MKTKYKYFSFPFIAISCLIGFLAFTACHKNNDSTIDNRPYTLEGNASGSQVVPSLQDSATATLTGTYNPATHVLNYTSNWTNLSGAPVSAGLYTGAMGASGIAVGNAWQLSGGSTGTVTGNVTLTDEQAAQLLSGNTYYTYATTNHPAGEIRGQISASR